MKRPFWYFLALIALATPALAQQSSAKNPIGWPPRLEVGQQWYVGIGKLGFQVDLNAKDSDGDPAGRASGSDGKTYNVFFFYNKDADLADLYMKSGNTGYRCLFDAKSVNAANPNDVTLVGAAFVYDATATSTADRFKVQTEPCLVTWTNAPNAPASIQTGNPVTTPTTPTTTPTPPATTTTAPITNPTNTATAPAKTPTAPLNLNWPPKVQSGQRWYLTLGSSGYDLSLTKSGANGISSGTAVSGPTTLESYLYFNSNENRLVLEMAAKTYTLYCSFGVRGAEDKVLNGDASFKMGNGNLQALKDPCALYLVSAPATTSALLPPLL